MRSALARQATTPPDAVVAAVRASAATDGDAALLAMRDEWSALRVERYAAFSVLEFAQASRSKASDQQKLAAGRLVDASMDALDDFTARAIALRARTPRGIAFKLEIAFEYAGDRKDITRSILADLAGLTSRRTVATKTPAVDDPIFTQIELHKALRIVAISVPGDGGDPAYDAAQREEEAAIQALGDMVPATIAGAAAQLAYMAEVEGAFADSGSPLLRTAVTVARALAARADT